MKKRRNSARRCLILICGSNDQVYNTLLYAVKRVGFIHYRFRAENWKRTLFFYTICLWVLFCLRTGSDIIDLRLEFGLKLTRSKNYKQLSQKLVTSFSERDCDWLLLQPFKGRVSLKYPIDREQACKQDNKCQIQLKVFVFSDFFDNRIVSWSFVFACHQNNIEFILRQTFCWILIWNHIDVYRYSIIKWDLG